MLRSALLPIHIDFIALTSQGLISRRISDGITRGSWAYRLAIAAHPGVLAQFHVEVRYSLVCICHGEHCIAGTHKHVVKHVAWLWIAVPHGVDVNAESLVTDLSVLVVDDTFGSPNERGCGRLQ